MSDTVTEEKQTTEQVVDEVVSQEANVDETQTEEVSQDETQKEEETVPLSAKIAERKKRQEAEQKVLWLEDQMTKLQQTQQPQQQPVDNSEDLLTVGQSNNNFASFKRDILEEFFLEQNPQTIERIKTELPEILKQPGNKWLADSIAQAPNRLQRAEQIMGMFGTKKEALPAPNRDNTPRSPQSVAKTNKLSIADRIMSMSDQELDDWRVSQKKKAR